MFVLGSGFDLEALKQMDIFSFRSLHESCSRIRARDIINFAQLTMVAAQGSSKNMKDILKPYFDLLQPTNGNDLDKFLSKYNKGI